MEDMKIELVQNLDTLGTILKSEIDMQIATAKAFPRSLTTFLKKTESMATVTAGVAESCSYALPRSVLNEKTGQYEKKILAGPSVRFAEIVVSSYGNIRAGARAISNDGRYVTCQGVCHDLETNTFISVEVKRKITNKHGKTFSEDMQVVTTNAGCAIAFRNAVFKVIPAALIIDVYDKVIEVAKGTAETLPARRDKALKFFRDKGVTDIQVCEALSIEDVKDIDLEKLQILSGMKASIVNNEFTVDELFPVPEDKGKNGKEKADQATQSTLNMMDSQQTKKNQGGKK